MTANDRSEPITAGESPQFDPTVDQPIVIRLRKKKSKKSKKSKRGYSKGLKEVQHIERHTTRAAHRLASSVEVGISAYRKHSRKSAGKKKDGALRDLPINSGLAATEALKEASGIPADLARAVDTKPMRKRVKRQLRGLSRSMRMWR